MGPCSFTKANEKAQHLHTVARTDRALAQELRAEVDQLDKELRRLDLEGLEFPARRLQELDVQLEAMHLEDCVKLFLQLSSQDTKDLEKLQVQRLAKERDLEDGMSHGAFSWRQDGKQLLVKLREARGSANQESLSLRRDRNHLTEDLDSTFGAFRIG